MCLKGKTRSPTQKKQNKTKKFSLARAILNVQEGGMMMGQRTWTSRCPDPEREVATGQRLFPKRPERKGKEMWSLLEGRGRVTPEAQSRWP